MQNRDLKPFIALAVVFAFLVLTGLGISSAISRLYAQRVERQHAVEEYRNAHTQATEIVDNLRYALRRARKSIGVLRGEAVEMQRVTSRWIQKTEHLMSGSEALGSRIRWVSEEAYVARSEIVERRAVSMTVVRLAEPEHEREDPAVVYGRLLAGAGIALDEPEMLRNDFARYWDQLGVFFQAVVSHQQEAIAYERELRDFDAFCEESDAQLQQGFDMMREHLKEFESMLDSN